MAAIVCLDKVLALTWFRAETVVSISLASSAKDVIFNTSVLKVLSVDSTTSLHMPIKLLNEVKTIGGGGGGGE